MKKAVNKLTKKEPQGKKMKKMARKMGREIDRGSLSLIFWCFLEKRTINRDVKDLEKEERKLLKDIKSAAAKGNFQCLKFLSVGNNDQVRRMAKQLVKVRQNKDKITSATYKMDDVKYTVKNMANNAVVAESMAKATNVVAKMNTKVKPQDLMKTMQAYEMEMEKANIKEEMMDGALEELDEDVALEDEIYNQVLEEVGIEKIGDLDVAPSKEISTKEADTESLGLPALEA